MNTVSMVLGWEMLRRGRYAIPAFALLANLFPIAIYAALRESLLPADDETRILMHVAFFPFITVILSIGVVIAQGRISRLYSAPLSNEFLVFWHMGSGALVLALLVAGSLALQNTLFSLQQSVLGPACLATSLWAAGIGLIHLSRKGVFRTQLLAAPVVLLLWWGFARYGSWTNSPREYWKSPTTYELVVIMAAIGLSYLLHLVLISRDRCGDFSHYTGITRWLERISELLKRIDPIRLKSNATPADALFWQFWSRRGLPLPLLSVAYALFFSGIVVVQNVIPEAKGTTTVSEFPDAYLAGGLILLSTASILFGFMAGSLKSNRPGTREQSSFADSVDTNRSEVMSSFLATRPVRDSQISRTVLKSVAFSVFGSGLIFWVGFAIVNGLESLLRGSSLQAPLLNVVGDDRRLLWSLVFISFALPWGLMANAAVIMMTGRETKVTLWMTSLVFISLLANSLFVPWVNPRLYDRIASTAVGLVALTGIFAILWIFLRARRTGQLSSRGIVLALTFWFVQILGSASLVANLAPIPGWILLVLATGLVVVPSAAAPLAVHWNRSR